MANAAQNAGRVPAGPPASSSGKSVNVAKAPAALGGGIEVSDFSARVTEEGSMFGRWAWKATFYNNNAHSKTLHLKVTFLDKDGFNLAEDLDSIDLGPRQRTSKSGYTLIPNAVSSRVSRAELSQR